MLDRLSIRTDSPTQSRGSQPEAHFILLNEIDDWRKMIELLNGFPFDE